MYAKPCEWKIDSQKYWLTKKLIQENGSWNKPWNPAAKAKQPKGTTNKGFRRDNRLHDDVHVLWTAAGNQSACLELPEWEKTCRWVLFRHADIHRPFSAVLVLSVRKKFITKKISRCVAKRKFQRFEFYGRSFAATDMIAFIVWPGWRSRKFISLWHFFISLIEKSFIVQSAWLNLQSLLAEFGDDHRTGR